jgi:hypothetical protein
VRGVETAGSASGILSLVCVFLIASLVGRRLVIGRRLVGHRIFVCRRLFLLVGLFVGRLFVVIAGVAHNGRYLGLVFPGLRGRSGAKLLQPALQLTLVVSLATTECGQQRQDEQQNDPAECRISGGWHGGSGALKSKWKHYVVSGPQYNVAAEAA